MNVWVGTSGFSYPEWAGKFYPRGTKPGHQLSFYAQQFPLVELNFTFYRPPTAAMLERLADQTPHGFRFIVKLPQTISHEESGKDLPGFRKAVEALRRRDQLLGLLCQLPQSIHHGKKHLDWLGMLSRELAGLHLAVEFRHRSWARPDVTEWLGERDVDLVAVDVPTIRGLYPRGLVQSTDRIYVRFHSRNAVNWYLGDKERYDYHYPDADLVEWLTAIRQREERTRSAYLLLNNCRGAQAVDNARRIRELLPRVAPELEVVEPFGEAATGPRQRTLFE
jgi:uncharacterized protein YecE (DUF72 family)